jgi:7-carboxy-7-deazaguanine synthase
MGLNMRIADLFYSVQGEGVLLGVPSAFVRTTGCNLRCAWCDTPYTSWEPHGTLMSVEEIMARLAEFPTRYVVLTGGEPLLVPEVDLLCTRLHAAGYHITVETAATVFRPLACDLASLSPKLSNSTPHHREGGKFALRHERQRLRPDVIRAFVEHSDYQIKFVIDRPDDIHEVEALLADLPDVDRGKVLLMPQGITVSELNERGPWVADLCKQHGFRFCPRLHIALYGNRRGT